MRARCRSPTSSPPIPARSTRPGCWPGPGPAIGERAARPKRIYAIPAIPLTAVGKHFKPALAADAARRAVAEALDRAGVSRGRDHGDAHEGGLVVTVAGADPGEVHSALAGSPSPSGPGCRRPRAARRPEETRSPPCRTSTPALRRIRQPISRSSWWAPGRSARRRPAAGRRGDPRDHAGTARRAASAAARGAPGRRGGPHPVPGWRRRRLPGQLPAVQRPAAARRPASGHGRIRPGAGRGARLPAGQHVPPARPGTAAARPGRRSTR